jgi:hypothetical protein
VKERIKQALYFLLTEGLLWGLVGLFVAAVVFALVWFGPQSLGLR